MVLTALPVWADKPDWAGPGKQHDRQESRDGPRQESARDGRDGHGERNDDHGGRDARGGHNGGGAQVQINIGNYFGDPQRQVARQAYGPEFHGRRCPPGLARKHNGCQPPGQARAYALGQPLPRSVVYYDVAPAVVVQIGLPPQGYRYVRVAADILLIAVGTGMVVDAIQDLSR